MKRLSLLVSVFVIVLMAFAAVASAHEASVFGDGVIIRAYLTGDVAPYSAYLEVRDDDGNILDKADFTVIGVPGTTTPNVTSNPFSIHTDDLVRNDISISYDSVTKIVYVFCTDTDSMSGEPNLHVMKYTISLNIPVSGVCGSANTQAYYTAPTSNLCGVGNASAVDGSGSKWTWMCYGNGIDDATNENCSAYKKVYGECGSSNGQTLTSAPTSNLCSVGSTESLVSGSGPWNWTCTGAYDGSTAPCSANKLSSGSSDLAITYYKAPGACENGISAGVIITNIGAGSAGQFKVKIYIGGSTTPAGAQLLTNGTQTISGLAAGQSMTLTFINLRYSGLAIHTYYHLIAVVDADNEVAETNEENNIKYRDIELL